MLDHQIDKFIRKVAQKAYNSTIVAFALQGIKSYNILATFKLNYIRTLRLSVTGSPSDFKTTTVVYTW